MMGHDVRWMSQNLKSLLLLSGVCTTLNNTASYMYIAIKECLSAPEASLVCLVKKVDAFFWEVQIEKLKWKLLFLFQMLQIAFMHACMHASNHAKKMQKRAVAAAVVVAAAAAAAAGSIASGIKIILWATF